MLVKIVVLSLVSLASSQSYTNPGCALNPLTPGCIPGLVAGSAAEAQWYAAQIAHAGVLAHHQGKRSAQSYTNPGCALNPLTPGCIPGLTSGSAAEAEWYAAQIAHAGQIAHHKGKRSAQSYTNPGCVLNPLTPGCIPGLTSGSAAEAEWYAAQIAHAGQIAHHKGKRSAQWPAGVHPSICPNYPFCNVAPVVPAGYTNTAGYPAGVSAAACPGYPYC